MKLLNVDLNLLKVLQALIEERNVTRAGERIGRSQPAMSNALNRLRSLFDDPLLVRGTGGLHLTPRAEALRDPVNDILGSIEDCLVAGREFDPGTARGIYRIAAPDYISLPALPPLLAHLSKTAPNLDLHIITEDRALALAALEANRVDIAIGSLENVKPSIRVERLFHEDFVCLVRKGHPVLEAPFTTRALLSYPHLLVSATGARRGIFDDILDRQGEERRIATSVSHFLLAPYLLERSDMIGVFTRRVSQTLRMTFQLEVLDIPFDFSGFEASMAWHLRSDRDPGLAWLRAQVQLTCREFTSSTENQPGSA